MHRSNPFRWKKRLKKSEFPPQPAGEAQFSLDSPRRMAGQSSLSRQGSAAVRVSAARDLDVHEMPYANGSRNMMLIRRRPFPAMGR